MGVTVLFRAQSSPLSSLSVMRKNRNQTMAKKNKKLVDPNHNGYEVASGSGSELQKSLLAFPANRAHFLVATVTAAPSLADMFTNKCTYMTEERGEERKQTAVMKVWGNREL